MGSKAELQVDDDDHILNEDAIDSVTLHRQIGKLKRQLVVKNNKKNLSFPFAEDAVHKYSTAHDGVHVVKLRAHLQKTTDFLSYLVGK